MRKLGVVCGSCLVTCLVAVGCGGGDSPESAVGPVTTRSPVTAPPSSSIVLNDPEQAVYESWLGFWSAYDALTAAPIRDADFTELRKFAIDSHARQIEAEIAGMVSGGRVDKTVGDSERVWTGTPSVTFTGEFAQVRQCGDSYIETFYDGTQTSPEGPETQTFVVQFVQENGAWKVQSGSATDGCLA